MLVLFSFLALLVFMIFLLIQKASRQVRNKIRNSWGKPMEKLRNFYVISRYSKPDHGFTGDKLTDQTLADIDIYSLFEFLDRTQTTLGQQYLYAALTRTTSDTKYLMKLKDEMDFFCASSDAREKIQYILHRYEKTGSSLVCDLLDEHEKHVLSANNAWFVLLTLSSVLVIPFLVFVPNSFVILFGIIVFALNLNLHYIMRHRNGDLFTKIRQASYLIGAAKKLSKQENPVDASALPAAIKQLGSFSRSYRFLDLGVPMNDLSSIAYYLLDLVRAVFLIEVHQMGDVYRKLLRAKDALRLLFDYVGRTDMILSVASLKAGSKTICHPSFTEKPKLLKFENAVHPLVVDCVPNSLSLSGTGLFITGSNMSGKSTFLRTVLINSILAQTIYLCFADEYTSSFLRSRSSVKVSDDLGDGSSYYFTEVNIVHDMVRQVDASVQNLFVIDEIFKGTNTVERIALAKSILQYLNTPENIVIASSHDMELLDLLGADFTKAYFIESIVDNHLSFGYRLNIGAQETRNAIRIIEMEGFPREIVREAFAQIRVGGNVE